MCIIYSSTSMSKNGGEITKSICTHARTPYVNVFLQYLFVFVFVLSRYQVSSSFVIKSKRTAVRCHCEHAAFGLHKSPKFAVCPHRNKTYKLVKTAGEGSYFQVISVDAFGLGCCSAADRNKERTDYYC